MSERIRAIIEENFPWNEDNEDVNDCHEVREAVVKITDTRLLDHIITSMRTKQQSIMRSEIQSWMSALEDHLNHRRMDTSTTRDILLIPRASS